jgi:hypothetical protein
MWRILAAIVLLFSSSLAGAVTPEAGLWAIDSEVDGRPGRGFQIDVQTGTLVLTFYGYNADGSAQWYLSAGALTNGAFTGTLDRYQRGAAFGHSIVPAVSAGNSGPVTITFADATHGQITLPGESPKAISRFVFANPPTITPTANLSALTGTDSYVRTVTSNRSCASGENVESGWAEVSAVGTELTLKVHGTSTSDVLTFALSLQSGNSTNGFSFNGYLSDQRGHTGTVYSATLRNLATNGLELSGTMRISVSGCSMDFSIE